MFRYCFDWNKIDVSLKPSKTFDDVIEKKIFVSLSNLCAAMLDAAGTSRTPESNYRCDQKYKYHCDMDGWMDMIHMQIQMWLQDYFHLFSRVVDGFLQGGNPLKSALMTVGLELVHLSQKCKTGENEKNVSWGEPSGLRGGRICEASAWRGREWTWWFGRELPPLGNQGSVESHLAPVEEILFWNSDNPCFFAGETIQIVMVLFVLKVLHLPLSWAWVECDQRGLQDRPVLSEGGQ